ncbi:MAG: hypothetical protein ABIY55_09060 [Kofleriaceae bacterium]
MLDQFPNHSASASICQQDLSSGLQRFLVPVRNAMLGSPCIDGTLADLDPTTPGVQHLCQVTAVTGRGTPAETDTNLPSCTPDDGTATNKPCWRLVSDPTTCARGAHELLEIEGASTLPVDAHVTATCTIEVPG